MHELGTIVYVIETIEKLAEEEKLTRVGSITLEVGEVSGIVPGRGATKRDVGMMMTRLGGKDDNE